MVPSKRDEVREARTAAMTKGARVVNCRAGAQVANCRAGDAQFKIKKKLSKASLASSEQDSLGRR